MEEETKDVLWDAVLRLKGHALQGRFTRRENLHLTLAFLGETHGLEAAKEAMMQISGGPVKLCLEGLEVFHRERGDCYWIGVSPNHRLMELREELCEGLRQQGFPLDAREYCPHLTLARGVLMADSFDRCALSQSLPPISIEANRISLMRSSRVEGRLTYTELFCKML